MGSCILEHTAETGFLLLYMLPISVLVTLGSLLLAAVVCEPCLLFAAGPETAPAAA